MTTPPHPRLDPERLTHVVRRIDDAVQQGLPPSAVVAISDRAGHTWAHVAAGATRDAYASVFPLASITKPIVALGVMRLVEQGALLLSDAVARYVPAFAQHGKDRVTIRQLLTHTSGLSVPNGVYDALLAARAPAARFLQAACDAPLAFEPGTRHAYVGTFGFEVLAELLTRVHGRSHTDVLRDEVFAPLGMRHTGFTLPDGALLADVRHLGSPAELRYWTSLGQASGGLLSCAPDLLTLGHTLLNEGRHGAYTLLAPVTLQVMTRWHTPGVPGEDGRADRPAFQALGWGKPSGQGVMLASDVSYGHSGASGTLFWVDPAADLTFVFLSAAGGPEPHHLPMRVLNAVYGAWRP